MADHESLRRSRLESPEQSRLKRVANAAVYRKSARLQITVPCLLAFNECSFSLWLKFWMIARFGSPGSAGLVIDSPLWKRRVNHASKNAKEEGIANELSDNRNRQLIATLAGPSQSFWEHFSGLFHLEGPLRVLSYLVKVLPKPNSKPHLVCNQARTFCGQASGPRLRAALSGHFEFDPGGLFTVLHSALSACKWLAQAFNPVFFSL